MPTPWCFLCCTEGWFTSAHKLPADESSLWARFSAPAFQCEMPACLAAHTQPALQTGPMAFLGSSSMFPQSHSLPDLIPASPPLLPHRRFRAQASSSIHSAMFSRGTLVISAPYFLCSGLKWFSLTSPVSIALTGRVSSRKLQVPASQYWPATPEAIWPPRLSPTGEKKCQKPWTWSLWRLV